MPDTNSTVATNGFDLSTVAAADISVTGCTDADWNATETITCGTSSDNHTIRIDRQTSTCAASSAITVAIDSSPGVINPAPINSGHTQGTADVYEINVKTRDGADATLDNSDVKVAPIEGVFVSATVDETLSFAVAHRPLIPVLTAESPALLQLLTRPSILFLGERFRQPMRRRPITLPNS